MSERGTIDAWRELYRFAVSSYFIDPFSEEIFPGEWFCLRHKCETALSTGGAFLSHDDFDVTIGAYISGCRQLFAIEVPTYVSVKVTNKRIATATCCNWDDYNGFQASALFENDLNVGLAIFDDAREWVLIKDPDIVYFLVVESTGKC